MKVVTDTVKAFARNEWIYYYYSKVRYNLQKYIDISFEGTEIISGLWLSGISSVSNRQALHENNIEMIISAVLGSSANFPYDFNYERADLRDTEDEDIITDFYRLVPIIHNELTNKRGVLVSCIFGRSRSASLLAAYLIKHRDMSAEEALQFIKSKRSQIDPNANYIRQLKQYEGEIQKEREKEREKERKKNL